MTNIRFATFHKTFGKLPLVSDAIFEAMVFSPLHPGG